MTFAKRQLPGHCLAIMLASWRGQSLVPAGNVAGLERAFNPARHPELEPKLVIKSVNREAGTVDCEISP